MASSVVPVKAKSSVQWIVKKESSTDPPNLFLTEDFKTFQRLTNIKNNNSYNWFTSELIAVKSFDGSINRGVLYKPDNFDSTKRYPVIFSFYENISDQLNKFLRPDFVSSAIDIPWLVSREYFSSAS